MTVLNELNGVRGAVAAPTGAGSQVIATMQDAPSNPDVTCLRARVALNIAQQKLSEARMNLKKAQETGIGVPQAKTLVSRAEMIVQKATTLNQRVTQAREATQTALTNYQTIADRARQAEQSALIEQERVQNARIVISRAQQQEFDARDCHHKQRKLNALERDVVTQLTSQKTSMTQ